MLCWCYGNQGRDILISFWYVSFNDILIISDFFQGEAGRPTFAVSGVQWGAFRDAAESYDK
jgi:hypothetical protein